MLGNVKVAKILINEMLEVQLEFSCYVYFKQRVDVLFSNRGDEVSMCHFTEIYVLLKN